MRSRTSRLVFCMAILLSLTMGTILDPEPLVSWGQEALDRDRSGQRKIIILGTTIVGSAARPRVVYELPWREPDTFQIEIEDPQRSFFQEIFVPLDKEQLEFEIKGLEENR